MNKSNDKDDTEDKKTKSNPVLSTLIRKRIIDGGEEIETPPVWLISFTDVIALMLTFFVLLYAMSDTDPVKFDRKMGITTQAFGEYSGPRNNAGKQEGVNVNRDDYEAGEDINYLRAVLDEILKKHDAMSFTTISKNEDELVLLFNIQEFDTPFLNFINELSPLLENLDNRITLMSSKSKMFEQLQKLGRQMRENGYKKPMVVAVAGDKHVAGDGIAIFIQPHTGNRVE
jgi:flagellar motor protein MotB